MLLILILVTAGLVASQTDEDVVESPATTTTPAPLAKVLTALSFEEQISSGKWFIKLYAPWCTHCQSLAPIWEELARALQAEDSVVNIATFDCTTAESLCTARDVRGYPTLLYIDAESQLQLVYKHHRTLTELLSFVHLVSRPVLSAVKTANALESILTTRDSAVIFVPGEVSIKSEKYKAVYQALARHTHEIESFVVAPALLEQATSFKSPLVIAKNGQFEIYRGDWTVADIEQWLDTHRFASWHKLTHFTFFEFINSPRDKIVVCLLDLSQDHDGYIRTMTSIAQEHSAPSWKSAFFWVDINVWGDLMNIWGVSKEQLPQLAVFDTTTLQHYLASELGTDSRGITKPAVRKFLEDVESGRAMPFGGKDLSMRFQAWLTRFAELVGFSVYSLKSEWPNFFNFLIAVALFLVTKLIFGVYKSNKRPAAAIVSDKPSDASSDVASSAINESSANLDDKKTN